jgi:hypothetical protein
VIGVWAFAGAAPHAAASTANATVVHRTRLDLIDVLQPAGPCSAAFDVSGSGLVPSLRWPEARPRWPSRKLRDGVI